MKKAALYLPFLLTGIFLIFISGCETTPAESCEQEDICVGKSVTACCTENNCYYEFNGVKYGDDAQSLSNLANALGCTNASAPNYDAEISDLILRLQNLSEIAKTNIIE